MKQFFRSTLGPAAVSMVAAGLVLSMTLGSGSALAHADHGKPQFGGVVAEAGMAQFEVVGKDGRITVHVTSHGTPVETAGASGKLTVLDGASKSEIDLAPAGENRLQGAGKVPAGAKLLLNVKLPGKPALQARAVMN